jgi:predicted DNA-binding transcriptional regulator
MSDRTTGWILVIASVLGIVVYFYLLFISPWCIETLKVSAFAAVGVVLLIIAWIGYTLATTPPPMPIEDIDFDLEDPK